MDKYIKIPKKIYRNYMDINGLIYIENFIEPEYEKMLIDFIDSQMWNDALKRRTQHYGYEYNYFNKNKAQKCVEIPDEFMEIKNKIEDFIENEIIFDQVIVNEYLPGQGISSHIDNPVLFDGVIVSLSLNSNIVMDLSHKYNHKHLLLKKCSLLILKDDARYKYYHGIQSRLVDNKIRRQRRISLTFRKINDSKKI